MNESMNLKELKNSNTLVSIYIDDLSNLTALEETFYSISKQSNSIDLLVLYPSELLEEQVSSLKNSLNNSKIIIRKTNEEGFLQEDVLNSDVKINYFLKATKGDSFPKIFNEGFNVAISNQYDFFSVIEPGDIININWYAQAQIYAIENSNVSMFFPLIRNTVNGVFSGLLNEAPWAEGLAEEAGKIDLNLLNRFNCIIPLCAVFRINSIKEYSEQKENQTYYPFKESMKISHYYEFLMRMIYNDVKGMSVPRIGYEFKVKNSDIFKHTYCKIPQNIVQIDSENGGMSSEEGGFWMNLAKKEYFFDEDRNKTYEKSN